MTSTSPPDVAEVLNTDSRLSSAHQTRTTETSHNSHRLQCLNTRGQNTECVIKHRSDQESVWHHLKKNTKILQSKKHKRNRHFTANKQTSWESPGPTATIKLLTNTLQWVCVTEDSLQKQLLVQKYVVQDHQTKKTTTTRCGPAVSTPVVFKFLSFSSW